MFKIFFITFLFITAGSLSFAQKLERTTPIKDMGKRLKILNKQKVDREEMGRQKKYMYGYIDRSHTTNGSLKHIAAMYTVSWVAYPLTQPDVFREKGSFKKYKNNFGRLVFDRDEPFWNWFVHPISG